MNTRRRFAIGGAVTVAASVAVMGLVAVSHAAVLADTPGKPSGSDPIALPAGDRSTAPVAERPAPASPAAVRPADDDAADTADDPADADTVSAVTSPPASAGGDVSASAAETVPAPAPVIVERDADAAVQPVDAADPADPVSPEDRADQADETSDRRGPAASNGRPADSPVPGHGGGKKKAQSRDSPDQRD